MRLLVEIDQKLADLRELRERLDLQTDEATETLNRMVCLEAARMMSEDKLKQGEDYEVSDWETILALCRLSTNWPNG